MPFNQVNTVALWTIKKPLKQSQLLVSHPPILMWVGRLKKKLYEKNFKIKKSFIGWKTNQVYDI